MSTGGNLRAYALLSFTALCWGANAIFARLAVGEISPMAIVSMRWIAVLVLLCVIAHTKLKRDWPAMRTRLPYLFIMGMLGFTVFNAMFYLSAYYTSALNIGIIQGAVPGFVLVGVFFAYGTRFTALQALGVLITIVGVIIVGVGGEFAQLVAFTINHGDILMVIACALYAAYAVALRNRPDVSSLSMLTVLAGAAFISSLPLLGIEIAMGQFAWPTPTGWIVLTLITLFPSLLAQIFFIQGVGLIGPGRAGVFVNLVPVFASLLAVLVLHEPFEVFHGVALGLVLGGIWLSEHGKPKTEVPEQNSVQDPNKLV